MRGWLRGCARVWGLGMGSEEVLRLDAAFDFERASADSATIVRFRVLGVLTPVEARRAQRRLMLLLEEELAGRRGLRVPSE